MRIFFEEEAFALPAVRHSSSARAQPEGMQQKKGAVKTVTPTPAPEPKKQVNHDATLLVSRGPASMMPLLDQDGELACATSLARTGEASFLGQALSDGLFLYINRINSREGGIGGAIPISLDQRDDESRLRTGAKNILSIKKSTPLVISPLSDGLLEQVLTPLVKKDEIACIFPVAGVRPRVVPGNLIYMRASYTDELHALVHYALNELKKDKIALFYEDGVWGQASYNALKRIMAFYKKELCVAASYQSGTVTIIPALKKIAHAQPQVVICVANGRPAYNFIREAVNQKMHNVSFLGISRLSGIQELLRKARGIGFTTSSVVPNPRTSTLPIVKKYREDMGYYLPNKGLTTYGLEGYINASLLAHVVKDLAPSATIGALLKELTSIDELHFGGLSLSYRNGGLCHSVWINDGPQTVWKSYQVGSGRR